MFYHDGTWMENINRSRSSSPLDLISPLESPSSFSGSPSKSLPSSDGCDALEMPVTYFDSSEFELSDIESEYSEEDKNIITTNGNHIVEHLYYNYIIIITLQTSNTGRKVIQTLSCFLLLVKTYLPQVHLEHLPLNLTTS